MSEFVGADPPPWAGGGCPPAAAGTWRRGIGLRRELASAGGQRGRERHASAPRKDRPVTFGATCSIM